MTVALTATQVFLACFWWFSGVLGHCLICPSASHRMQADHRYAAEDKAVDLRYRTVEGGCNLAQ